MEKVHFTVRRWLPLRLVRLGARAGRTLSLLLCLTLAACGGKAASVSLAATASSQASATATSSTGSPPASLSGAATSASSTSNAPQRGTARVAYAGSLVEANEQVIGPAFEKATGFKYLAVKAGGSFGV
ncbi:MAG: hypothetical protein M1296_02120, partial [Chloroflexi bacterium]|nr:hypothetical protein [Chloroflexota bacterium]